MVARAALLLFAIACGSAQAAVSFALETPRWISVAGGESAVVAVKFFGANGQPAVGEAVTFTNDGCGFFPNGRYVYPTTVGADGRAVATFTASNPPGITCWIYAGAGSATATVDVLTFRASEVQVQAAADASPSRPGKPSRVRVKPAYWAYTLRNVDLEARVVSGPGSVTPERANTGDAGAADFEVTSNDPAAASVIEFAYRGQKTQFTVLPPTAPWQDLWWVGKSEDGWGMSIVQHREQLFCVIYAYDGAGKPTWFVIPGGSWNAARTEFTGEVYVPTGAPFYAYDTAKFIVGPPVGTVKLTVDGLSRMALDYKILGKAGHKDLVRNDFGPIDITVQPGAGDMWWGGPAQNGWGVAVLQQYKTLFLVWFTYDATGAPTWFVMPGGSWTTLDTYSGRVYRASSMAWLGATYDPGVFHTTDVGSFALKFNASDAATLTYAIEGRTGSIPLSRTPF